MPLKFLSGRKVWAWRARFADGHRPRRNGYSDVSGVVDQAETDLAASRQFDIDLSEQLRVEERPVLHPLAAVDAEAHAQSVEAVLGAGMTSACKS